MSEQRNGRKRTRDFLKLVAIGRLTANPETKSFRVDGEEKSKVMFSLAKGRAIVAEGRLEQSRWTKNEENRRRDFLALENFHFLYSPRKNGNSAGSGSEGVPDEPVDWNSIPD
mgnify:CR=1 FL=1